MKRYLIFAAVGPFFGGLLLLFATTVASGYWTETNWSEVENFFVTFAETLQYSYLLSVVPALMLLRAYSRFAARTGRGIVRYTIDAQSSTGFSRAEEVGTPPLPADEIDRLIDSECDAVRYGGG